jgi:hypothetical protein
MKFLTRLALCCLLILLAAFTLSCGVPAQPSGAASANDTPAPTNLPGAAIPPDGDRLLPDPATGLASLPGYKVSFRQDITGWVEAHPYEKHTHIELTRSGGNIDYLRELSGSMDKTSYLRAIVLGQAAYRWQSAAQDCQGTAGSLQKGELVEPASLLAPLRTAAKIGAETVNGIPSMHYHFDQNSIALAEPVVINVSGDVWLAESGGYVVRYSVVVPLPAKLTGKNRETRQNWSYELRPLEATDDISLPESCPGVPIDLPTLPDAQ